jgi:guanyl-specific ribonuclease Sa
VSAPSVYGAINAISAELAQNGIAKARLNELDDYKYRSIDDVLDRLAPLLAKHRLCVLPKVLKRSAVERRDEAQRSLFHVSVKVAFALTSVDDGSAHTIEAYGEALDPSDKATAKAMAAAYKTAMVQTFCIPLAGTEDPDRSSPKVSSKSHSPEPVQGWQQWARDIEDIVGICESEAAIDLVQERNRELLNALSREGPHLYRELGHSFGARREVLQEKSETPKPRKRRPSAGERSVTEREKEHT